MASYPLAYARAGVPEVWLVDLRHDVVEVHRDPTPKGYQTFGSPAKASR